jgi:hypothetical protein
MKNYDKESDCCCVKASFSRIHYMLELIKKLLGIKEQNDRSE